VRQESREEERPLREFIGCSGYPNASTHAQSPWYQVSECNEGEFVRRGSAGKGAVGGRVSSTGCSRYPDCDFTSPHMPIGGTLPEVRRTIHRREGSKIGTVHSCIKEGL